MEMILSEKLLCDVNFLLNVVNFVNNCIIVNSCIKYLFNVILF